MEGLVMFHQNQMAATTGLRKEGKGRAWPRENLEATSIAFTTTHIPFLESLKALNAWVFMTCSLSDPLQIPSPLPKFPISPK